MRVQDTGGHSKVLGKVWKWGWLTYPLLVGLREKREEVRNDYELEGPRLRQPNLIRTRFNLVAGGCGEKSHDAKTWHVLRM